jgi:hypothetical protein
MFRSGSTNKREPRETAKPAQLVQELLLSSFLRLKMEQETARHLKGGAGPSSSVG